MINNSRVYVLRVPEHGQTITSMQFAIAVFVIQSPIDLNK